MGKRGATARRWRRTTAATTAGLALLVFLGWLGRRDVVTSHEARVGQTARVMADAGWPWAARAAEATAVGVRDNADGLYAVPRFDAPPMRVNPWLVPVINGHVRLQKPPLPNWCAAVLYRLFGVSAFATRLAPALLAALATLLVADLARLVLGRRAALPAALVWASTLVVVSEFREATADPFLAFFTLAAAWAWVRASERRGRTRTGLLVPAFYASLGLGVLAKGPFLFLHAAIALLAYQFCCRRRPHAPWGAHVAGIGLMLAIALPWPMYVATRVDNVALLWEMEATRGGGATAGEVLRLSWRYLPRIFEMTVPWTPLWLIGMATVVRGRMRGARRRRRWFPVLWCAATVLAFSLSPEKKNAYLLPMIPAQVLLVATGLSAVVAAARRARTRKYLRAVVGTQAAVGLALVVAAGVMLAGRATPADVAAVLSIGGAAVVLVVVGIRRGHGGSPRWFAPQAAGCALACLLTVAFARAAKDNVRSAKPFAALAGPVMAPPAGVFVPGLAEEAAFYLPLGLRYDPRARELYDAVEPPRGKPLTLAKFNPPLPHGRVVATEIVDLPGERADAHWRLVRITVEPDGAGGNAPTATAADVTSPAFPATPSSDPR